MGGGVVIAAITGIERQRRDRKIKVLTLMTLIGDTGLKEVSPGLNRINPFES